LTDDVWHERPADISNWQQPAGADVIVTTAGALASRYVFHVMTIGPKTGETLRVRIRFARWCA
jgi:hypothetical protein